MLGLPGCSLPNEVNPEGLPIGLQLNGSWFDDQNCFECSTAWQSRNQVGLTRAKTPSPQKKDSVFLAPFAPLRGKSFLF
jgi:Asp-tRNA(Asn)/Glu-tRNA(Gln) amidotransferase A subunit family amidase